MQAALGAFYGACDVVLSPSAASDARLGELGVAPGQDRPLRPRRRRRALRPAQREPGRFGGPADRVHVLYAGRQTIEKGVDLLADAFLAARERDPRLHLLLAGGGPEEGRLRERLGDAATFLGWLDGDELADRPTRAPTCCCSAPRPTRSARCCSRRRPPACRWWRSGRRPGGADPLRALRRALPARRRRDRRRRRPPRRRLGRPATGWRAAASPRSATGRGTRRWADSRRAGAARS